MPAALAVILGGGKGQNQQKAKTARNSGSTEKVRRGRKAETVEGQR
jgi:hypothetical protein